MINVIMIKINLSVNVFWNFEVKLFNFFNGFSGFVEFFIYLVVFEDIFEIKIVVLIVLVICCNVLNSVVLCGYKFGVNWFKLYVCVVMINMSLIINMLCMIIICIIDVLGVMFLNKNIVIFIKIMLGMIIIFGLNLLNSLFVIGFIMVLIIFFGSMIIFDLKVVMSKMVCRNIGNKVIVENNDIIIMIINLIDNVNIGILNVCNFKIGFLIFNCWMVKIYNEISLIIKVLYIFVLDYFKLFDVLKLYISLLNFNVDKRIDG